MLRQVTEIFHRASLTGIHQRVFTLVFMAHEGTCKKIVECSVCVYVCIPFSAVCWATGGASGL